MDELKRKVGIEAAKFVESDMVVGLGTGSTAKFFVEELGRRVKEEGLDIIGVTTSHVTHELAKSLGIPLRSIDDVEYVDLTVDGADEVDSNFNGIKGGGAALLMEKIVASYSKKCLWIVDENKLVDKLGKFPLPVEVIPYGHDQLLRKFGELDLNPKIRLNMDGEFLLTDTGHYIIDLFLEEIPNPHELAAFLDSTVGVVEHGLFIGMIDKVIIGTKEGVKILEA
ncbi:ribose-5-phosphate isomerase RpiA [Streptococcaceae bacterium ESL0687]|nr:ribose-5-phosphate isomerase RpiA [Streptococcaceae bacterium ESL0687]